MALCGSILHSRFSYNPAVILNLSLSFVAAMSSVAIFRAYQQSFDTHPYTTLAITNGALNALADLVAQTAQNLFLPPRPHDLSRHSQSQPFDLLRTARFFAFGFGMGPLIGRWNFFLEHNLPLRALGARSKAVSFDALSKRVSADQLLVAPIGLGLFLGSMGVMEGRDPNHIAAKFKDLYLPLLVANWQVWPLAQLINFRYMPLPYRVPFQSTCGVFWTLYLSIANSRESQIQDRRDSIRNSRQ